jgi:hypothetical protein
LVGQNAIRIDQIERSWTTVRDCTFQLQNGLKNNPLTGLVRMMSGAWRPGRFGIQPKRESRFQAIPSTDVHFVFTVCASRYTEKLELLLVMKLCQIWIVQQDGHFAGRRGTYVRPVRAVATDA